MKNSKQNEDENITSDEAESMDVDTACQTLQASNILVNVYATFVILEGKLHSAKIQAAVVNNHGKLQSALNKFQNTLKKKRASKK